VRIIAYVDGFSVYYACFRGPTKAPHVHLKWLDYRGIFRTMFPEDEIALVRVYTAIAPNPPHDPSQAMRHDTFLRALRTLAGVEVFVGRFQKAKREAVLVRPPENVDPNQTVYIYQEKQSDVSLASHLLIDAFDDRFDRAVIFTNDSDFVTPIRLVRDRFNCEVFVLSPDTVVNKELAKAASAAWVFDRNLLAKCQLPDELSDADGRHIRKPARWASNGDPN
jgi:uncharacterized LabA/DUF88 family protein